MARHIGDRKILGYSKGKLYPLLVSRLGFFGRIFKGYLIEVKKLDNTGRWYYVTEKQFLGDWLVITDNEVTVNVECKEEGDKDED
jgi:hypothetical protein